MESFQWGLSQTSFSIVMNAVSEVCSIDTCPHCGTFTCKSCYCISYYWGFASICSFGRISYPQTLRFVFASALLNLLFEYLVMTKFTICLFEDRLAGKFIFSLK